MLIVATRILWLRQEGETEAVFQAIVQLQGFGVLYKIVIRVHGCEGK